MANETILNRAIVFATKVHTGATRKGTNLPYILHPLEALTIAATLTDDEDVLCATVLHDVIEDTPVTPSELEREFGKRITSLVLAESENKREGIPKADSWKIRKQETIDFLNNRATKEQKLIAFSDKLSNLRSFHQNLLQFGDDTWSYFNCKDKNLHHWYYDSIFKACPEFVGSAAYEEYEKLLKEVFSN